MKKSKKIILIQPKIVSLEEKVYSYGWCPPLGLLALGSYLKKKHLNIELLDETISPIQKNLEGDILGLSCNLVNYKRALQIAQTFKENNPKGKIIIGGPHSILGENILRNNNYIDAVIYGFDGEESFLDYVEDKELEKIYNLIWRKNNKIVKNPEKLLDLTEFLIPDRTLIQLEEYFKNFKDINFSRPTTIYTTKGCPHGKCSFCMLSGQKNSIFRTRNFEQIWQEVSYLQKNFKIDYIWNVTDSPTKGWFLKLLETKPINIDIAFRFYGRSKEIDEKTAKVLKELNTYEVFLGIESGDNEILKKMQKGETIEDHLNAVKNLTKYGIKPRTAFVLGAEGETNETLEKTYRFAEELLNMGADSIPCSVFTPVPGSKAHQKLSKIEKFRDKYSKKDLLEPLQLQKEWIKYFTNTNYKTVQEFINKFQNICKKKGKLF